MIIQEEWVQNFGGTEMIVGIVWVAKLFSVITHVVSSYVNLSEQTKVLHKKSSTPTELVCDTNMAAVSLFWDTNMAAVTSLYMADMTWKRSIYGS